jgi:hypothetical protein
VQIHFGRECKPIEADDHPPLICQKGHRWQDNDGDGNGAADDDDDDDDNSDGTADDEDDVYDNDEDVNDADNDNLPPRVGKRNDGCDEKKTEEEETVADSVVIHTTIKQITGRGGGRW